MQTKKAEALDKLLTQKMEIFLKRNEVEIIAKEDSKLMKIINFFLFFNPNFMTRFITVIGNKIYKPRSVNSRTLWIVYCHEYIHICDWKNHKFWFKFSYLFPQILALGVLGVFFAFLSLKFLWCLLFLIFLLPIPAPFRAKWEFRGYAVTITAPTWVGRRAYDVDFFVPQFTGWNYYKMWPFERDAKKQLKAWQDKLEHDIFKEMPAAKRLKKYIRSVEVLHARSL